jgi:hypothetical protein
MIKKYIAKLLIVFTLAVFLLPGVLHADFEPAITIDAASTGATPQLVPDGNLDAVVTAPAVTAGYSITNYVYKWNNSNTALTTGELGAGDANSVPPGAPIVISVVADTQFGTSDGDAWYLHVKTVYFSVGAGIELSDDTIVGPYTFDNVAPSAIISLDTTVAGQTATTAAGSPVTIVVTGALGDINSVYVNTAEQFATATAKDFSDPATATFTYAVAGTGAKTLYAWFEDATGNISDAVSLNFTILAGKSMDPAGAMNLEVDATQAFVISGGGAETFDWSIVDATTGLESTAASFTTGYSTIATVTIKGVAKDNTIKVKAKSTVDAAEYLSGIITIKEKAQSFCLDIDDNGVVDAFTDGYLVIRYLFGFPGSFLVDGVIGAGANRTAAADIIAYLDAASTSLALDIDDNGAVDAFTDGYLVIRYLFGFPGSFLVDGVIGAGANRAAADDIITYLDAAKCGL